MVKKINNIINNYRKLKSENPDTWIEHTCNQNDIISAISIATLSRNHLSKKHNHQKMNAYLDVLNQVLKIENYTQSFVTKKQESEILIESISISNSLFYSARADYAEVLLTQREALEAKLDLIEIKLNLLKAKVNVYRALGGGWR